MPIEIRELNIKVSVSNGGDTANGVGTTSTGPASESPQGSGSNNAALIEEAVEKVLEILKHQTER